MDNSSPGIGDIVKAKGRRFLITSQTGYGYYVIPEKSLLAKRLLPLIERNASRKEFRQTFSDEERREIKQLEQYVHYDKLSLIKRNNWKMREES
jgi:hypothetical protein